MSIGILVGLLGIAYSLLYFLDTMMKSCLNIPYLVFLQSTGIEIKLLQVKWYTQSFNKLFSRLGTWRPRLLYVWFSVGSWLGGLLVVPAMVLLVKTLIDNLVSSSATADPNRIVLQPVLPGVNMPLEELGYYFLTLLICSVIHEAGHAVAAVSEDVRVLGFGAFVLFVVPAAFVDLPTDRLLALRPVQQLRVFTAGIWHNIVLAVIAYLLMFSVASLYAPLYRHGAGVTVTHVTAGSAVTGPTGLVKGDHVTALNQCPVRNASDWRQCIVNAITSPTVSFCMSRETISTHENTLSVINKSVGGFDDCCGPGLSANSLCFLDVDKRVDWRQFSCLPVRTVLEQSPHMCNTSSDCPRPDNLCMRPSLENTTRLITVERSNSKDFLFVGNPAEVYYQAQVTEYVPKFQMLPLRLPAMTRLLSSYVASFSGALAVLNVVPCFCLDGQHITRVLVDILLGCSADIKKTKFIVTLTMTIIGTTLLLLNIAVGLWTLF